MADFPAIYYGVPSTKYPESGSRVQLSNSYMFTAKANSPDQRIFTVTLEGMCYFLDDAGDLTSSTNRSRNMAVLEDFYLTHKLNGSFNFNHPVYGTVVVKFNRPLEIPEGIPGGSGVLYAFTVELIEQP
jgi:hypothetical protein